MQKLNNRTELGIKALIIDRLLKDEATTMIACEVPFADKRRKADIIQIIDNKLYAYEIKSAFDNLTKLPHQLKDYSVSFDYLSIVCDKRHLDDIKKHVPRTIGISLVSNETVSIIRAPSLRKRISKNKLLSFVGRKYLSQVASKYGCKNASSKPIEALRGYLNKRILLSEAHKIAVDFLLLKHSPVFKSFLAEKGKCTNIEDVLLLSGSYSQVKDH